MFNILDFIDSKDIREYNKDTRFTPIEQAVLICHSEKTTFEEKLVALRELMDSYGEEELEIANPRQREHVEKSGKQILTDTISAYEKALAQRERTEGVVFEADFYESEFPDPNCRYPVYFPDYLSAFAYIREEKQHYLENENLQDCQTQARIAVKDYGGSLSADTVFYFDNELRMTAVSLGYSCTTSFEYPFLDELFAYVPLPFKKGDIIRSIVNGKKMYWILPDTPDKEYFSRAVDWSDMLISGYTYTPGGEIGYFEYGQFEPLGVEICPDDELPEELYIMFLLREVYAGEMDFGNFLNLYSIHGGNAYKAIYGDRKPGSKRK